MSKLTLKEHPLEYHFTAQRNEYISSFVQFQHFTIYPFMCVKAPFYFDDGCYKFKSNQLRRNDKPVKLFRMKALLYSFSRHRRGGRKVVNFYVNTKNPVVCKESFVYDYIPKHCFREIPAFWREYSFLFREDWSRHIINQNGLNKKNDYFSSASSYYPLSFKAMEIIFSINKDFLRRKFIHGAFYKKSRFQLDLFLTTWNSLREVDKELLIYVDDYHGGDSLFSFLVSSYGVSKPTYYPVSFLKYKAKRTMVKKLRSYILNNNFFLLPKPVSKTFFDYFFSKLNGLVKLKLYLSLFIAFCFFKNLIFFDEKNINYPNISLSFAKNIKVISISFFSNIYFYHRFIFKRTKNATYHSNQPLIGNYNNYKKSKFMLNLLKNNKLFGQLSKHTMHLKNKNIQPTITLYQKPFAMKALLRKYDNKDHTYISKIQNILKKSSYLKKHYSKTRGFLRDQEPVYLEESQLSFCLKILSYLLKFFYRNNIAYCVTAIFQENQLNEPFSNATVINLMFFKLFTALNNFSFIKQPFNKEKEKMHIIMDYKKPIYKYFRLMKRFSKFNMERKRISDKSYESSLYDFKKSYKSVQKNCKNLKKLGILNYNTFSNFINSPVEIYNKIKSYDRNITPFSFKKLLYRFSYANIKSDIINSIPLSLLYEDEDMDPSPPMKTLYHYMRIYFRMAVSDLLTSEELHGAWLKHEISRRANYFKLMVGNRFKVKFKDKNINTKWWYRIIRKFIYDLPRNRRMKFKQPWQLMNNTLSMILEFASYTPSSLLPKRIEQCLIAIDKVKHNAKNKKKRRVKKYHTKINQYFTAMKEFNNKLKLLKEKEKLFIIKKIKIPHYFPAKLKAVQKKMSELKKPFLNLTFLRRENQERLYKIRVKRVFYNDWAAYHNVVNNKQQPIVNKRGYSGKPYKPFDYTPEDSDNYSPQQSNYLKQHYNSKLTDDVNLQLQTYLKMRAEQDAKKKARKKLDDYDIVLKERYDSIDARCENLLKVWDSVRDLMETINYSKEEIIDHFQAVKDYYDFSKYRVNTYKYYFQCAKRNTSYHPDIMIAYKMKFRKQEINFYNALFKKRFLDHNGHLISPENIVLQSGFNNYDSERIAMVGKMYLSNISDLKVSPKEVKLPKLDKDVDTQFLLLWQGLLEEVKRNKSPYLEKNHYKNRLKSMVHFIWFDLPQLYQQSAQWFQANPKQLWFPIKNPVNHRPIAHIFKEMADPKVPAKFPQFNIYDYFDENYSAAEWGFLLIWLDQALYFLNMFPKDFINPPKVWYKDTDANVQAISAQIVEDMLTEIKHREIRSEVFEKRLSEWKIQLGFQEPEESLSHIDIVIELLQIKLSHTEMMIKVLQLKICDQEIIVQDQLQVVKAEQHNRGLVLKDYTERKLELQLSSPYNSKTGEAKQKYVQVDRIEYRLLTEQQIKLENERYQLKKLKAQVSYFSYYKAAIDQELQVLQPHSRKNLDNDSDTEFYGMDQQNGSLDEPEENINHVKELQTKESQYF